MTHQYHTLSILCDSHHLLTLQLPTTPSAPQFSCFQTLNQSSNLLWEEEGRPQGLEGISSHDISWEWKLQGSDNCIDQIPILSSLTFLLELSKLFRERGNHGLEIHVAS